MWTASEQYMKRLLLAALAAFLCLSATAREIGRAQTENELLILTDSRAGCPDGTQVAVWGGRGKEPVQGCWFEKHGRVWILFADGDNVGVLVQNFKFAES
jgi:hypothetical protein